MRLPIFTLVFLAAAGVAQAQMGTMMMNPMPQSTATYGGDFDAGRNPSQQERYAEKIAALKAKMMKLTAADGGQLSAEHRASLQKELDSLNRQFGLKVAGG
jgi:hypothetical protein